MKTERTVKTIGIYGLAVAAAFSFAGCSGLGGGQETETTTTVADTVKPTVETVTATTTTTTTTVATTTAKETETTKPAGLSHENSDIKEETTEKKADTGEYIFPDSNSRKLSKDDLKGFDVVMVRRARNEIFARHGFIFNDEGLDSYFQSKSWYNGTVPPSEHSNVKLNEYETANRDLFLEVEDEMLHDLYREVLGSGKYVLYKLVHLNEDGIKDLVVAENYSSSGGNLADNCLIYTIKDGDVKFAGEINGGFAPLQFSSATKRILYARGGGGAVEDIFYNLNGTKLAREEYMWMTDSSAKCYHNYRSDDAGMGDDVYDYNDEISQDECERGSNRLREGMEDMVFERL